MSELRVCSKCGAVENDPTRGFIGFHESLRGKTLCDGCAEENGCVCCLLHLDKDEREERMWQREHPDFMRIVAAEPPRKKTYEDGLRDGYAAREEEERGERKHR
jgi:hypothetical protein